MTNHAALGLDVRLRIHDTKDTPLDAVDTLQPVP